MSNEILRKITLKGIGVQPEPMSITKEMGVVDLCRVYGVVTDTKVYISKNAEMADSTAFLGDFEAVNLQTGEVFNSAKLFLPQFLEELLASALSIAAKQGDLSGIQFAFQIGAKFGPSARGYVFTGKPLIEPKNNDVMAEMKASFPPYVPAKQLEAPKGKK